MENKTSTETHRRRNITNLNCVYLFCFYAHCSLILCTNSASFALSLSLTLTQLSLISFVHSLARSFAGVQISNRKIMINRTKQVDWLVIPFLRTIQIRFVFPLNILSSFFTFFAYCILILI